MALAAPLSLLTVSLQSQIKRRAAYFASGESSESQVMIHLLAYIFSSVIFLVILCKRQLFYPSPVCKLKLPTSVTCHLKLPTMPKSFEPQRLTVYIDNFNEKLWSVTPQPLKDFPFQDSKVVFLQQLLLAGKKALKLSLLMLYVCSYVSHIVYSVSRNKDLMALLGLFVGCVATILFTEMSKELFPFLEEHDVRQHLVGSCCLFALIEIISTCFVSREKVFILHAADGGLMQALWLWKNYPTTEKI